MSWIEWSLRAMPAPASKVEEWVSLLKSQETTWSSVLPRMPLKKPSDACFTTFLMSSYLAAFSRQQVRSTTDPFGVGTRKAMPVSFLFSPRMTLLTALAVPVETGVMSWAAPQLSHHSFPEGPSLVFWVTVMAWTVVMSLSSMPKLLWMTLARGPSSWWFRRHC